MSYVNDLRMSLNQKITQTGEFGLATVSDESKVRIIVDNAASNCVVLVKARIIGQEDWDTISTINGNSKLVVNVSTYDQIILECTNYASASDFVRIIAGSFNEAGGATSIGAPTGGILQDKEVINFTSSDSSVIIVADQLTSSIDFTVGSGGSGSKYVLPISSGDWTDLGGGEFSITVAYSVHNKINPVVISYEYDGGVYKLVEVAVSYQTNNNLTITSLQAFTGRIIIN